jgi:hypothetical protein
MREYNEDNEPRLREEWEFNHSFERMGLRNRPGRRATWKFNKANGKMVRENKKGGIDWWRYQTKILIPKLLPFAKRCKLSRPNTVVQEDKAPSHASKWQSPVFLSWDILRFLWPGNSPDLNMIEPCWPWMKRYTTSKGAPSISKTAKKLWLRCWARLPQTMIQKWIERIPRHIEEIIRLKGGNEYRKGRAH